MEYDIDLNFLFLFGRSLSGILLIKPNQHHAELLKFSPKEQLKTISNSFKEKFIGTDQKHMQFNQKVLNDSITPIVKVR